MRTLILFAVFSFALAAKEIEVSDQNRKYKIDFDEKNITYKDESMDISFSYKKCNAHILERFNKQINRFLEKPFLEDSRPEFLKIKMDGKSVYEPRFGERAVYFIQMNQEVKKLKIEESLNCQKH